MNNLSNGNGHHTGNGHNGHNGHAKVDLGLRAPTVTPCSLRLGQGSWCNRLDGHDGDHEGVPPDYDVPEARPALWRRHRGRKA